MQGHLNHTDSDEIKPSWQACSIWYPKARDAVNFHLFARKTWHLPSVASKAVLRISAFTEYSLFVNGVFAGRGPLPGDPGRLLFYDTHDVAGYLRLGKNVIGILCHNYGIGTHWQHKGPGGLIAQLEIETEEGPITICTDESWKVQKAECFRSNSPRMFWSAGFMETLDFHRFEKDWLDVEFDDTHWETPEVLGSHPARPGLALEPREIPQLREGLVASVGIERGRFELARVHAVSFGQLLPPGEAGLVYAQTFVQVEETLDVVLHAVCDDAFKVFLNGERILEQNYNEEFARTRVWRGLDEYDQVHYGMTGIFWPLKVPVQLVKGWNRLTVAVDQGPGGWGFVCVFLKPGTKEVLDLLFSADMLTEGQWAIAGPFESTGLNDSLDHVAASLDDLPASPVARVDPFRYDEVTDYATLMAFEQRNGFVEAESSGQITLNEGECCIADLGNVRVGYPTLSVETTGDAILDIGYSQILFHDRRIRFSNDGMMKYVDRVYAEGGQQEWQPMQRRTGRYVHVSCRKGRNVRLGSLGMRTIGYPVEKIGHFECSDPVLNRIWEVSQYTTALLMQYGYQDCLKREQGTLNPNSFNYMSRAAACCFGDTLLARAGLRTAILTQHDNGWFDSHGFSSPNCDEVTQCLYWIVWLRDYLLYAGDLDFVADVFDGVENNLRFFSKMINRHGLIDGRNYHIYRPGYYVYLDDTCMYGTSEWAKPLPLLESEILGFNILFYAALSAAATLAATLGLEERAAYYRKRARRVHRSCNERFWDEKKGLYAEWWLRGERAKSYHPVVQIAALYFDLCDEDQRAQVLDYLVNTLGLPGREKADYPLRTFGFYYYLLEVLFRHRHEHMALELMRRYYGSWLNAGATTFGEYYHMAEHNQDGRLDFEYEVHGYGTSAHLHFYTNILGVQPMEPGFKKVSIAPHPGDLQWARGQIATPLGQIRVAWQVNDQAFALEVDLPQGCVYKVESPHAYQRCAVRVNGEEVKAIHLRRTPVRRTPARPRSSARPLSRGCLGRGHLPGAG